ncbi:MAG: hypothetical protein ABL962_01335 [Fimbriimonadaceae bacterium]
MEGTNRSFRTWKPVSEHLNDWDAAWRQYPWICLAKLILVVSALLASYELLPVVPGDFLWDTNGFVHMAVRSPATAICFLPARLGWVKNALGYAVVLAVCSVSYLLLGLAFPPSDRAREPAFLIGIGSLLLFYFWLEKREAKPEPNPNEPQRGSTA